MSRGLYEVSGQLVFNYCITVEADNEDEAADIANDEVYNYNPIQDMECDGATIDDVALIEELEEED